jgi:hypothetical protein
MKGKKNWSKEQRVSETQNFHMLDSDVSGTIRQKISVFL